MFKFECDRINQLEAMKIDNECADILKSTLVSAFELFSFDKLNYYMPEIRLAIDFIYFR